MKEYYFIKKELENIINSEEIKYDGTYISIYDLKNIIDIELEELFNVLNSVETLTEEINKKRKNIINKILKKEELNKVQTFEFYTEKNIQKIKFYFENETPLIVCKENNKDKIFFETIISEEKQKLIKDNLVYIINSLNIIEYYKEKYNFEISENNIKIENSKQVFTYNIINIILNISNKTNISITSIKELEPTFNKEWLTKEKLSTYTNKNMIDILKRIPININELNPLYKNIIYKTLLNKKKKTKK